jgi:hypothetical protein
MGEVAGADLRLYAGLTICYYPALWKSLVPLRKWKFIDPEASLLVEQRPGCIFEDFIRRMSKIRVN